jgi:hypothetical protein
VHRSQSSVARRQYGDGPDAADVTNGVDPLDGGARSRVTFALDFDGHGVGKPLLPAVRRQTQKVAPTSYRRLKDRLERGREQPTAP